MPGPRSALSLSALLITSIVFFPGVATSETSTAPVPGSATPSPGFDPAERAIEILQREQRWAGVPGLSVAVVEGRHLVFQKTLGYANVELAVPVTASTVFQLSSTSKAFTGVAVARLAFEGRLDLDAPLGQLLPRTPESWAEVTVRQIMGHVSGLPEVLECETADRSEALTCVSQLDLRAPPATEFRYNQTNYFLALLLLEQLEQAGFADLMRSRVFEPLGMLSTRYSGSHLELVPGRATSYYPDDHGGLRLREFDFPEYLYSAAGLNSSLEDLIRFAVGLDDLLGPGLSALWQQPALENADSSSYGLGWDLRTHAPGVHSAGHEGGGLTTLQRFFRPDREDLTVIVLANGRRHRFDVDDLAAELADCFAPEIELHRLRLLDRMKEAVLAEDPARLKHVLREFDEAPSTRDLETEDLLNRLGYQLLDRAPEMALTVFRLNTERHPDSANVWDSLGEGLAETGSRVAAIESYRKVLLLDPTHVHAREQIEKLSR